MIRFLLLTIILLFTTSCEQTEMPILDDMLMNDTVIVLMDNIAKEPIFDFNSFSNVPDTLSDCACYFSISKNVFYNQQYIFAGSVGEHGKSFMKFKGDWVRFELDSIAQIKDSLKIRVLNDSLTVSIKAIKDSIIEETAQYHGEIQIKKNGINERFRSNMYGKCF